MTSPIITKRLVYHLGGYDPVAPDAAFRRFERELGRFERTWSAGASLSEFTCGPDLAQWRIVTKGPNWCVETDYRLVRWDDIIAAGVRRRMWRRIPLALLAFVDFVSAGALRGYLRENWRYAGFFLYPFVLLAALAGIAALAGALVAQASGSASAGVLAGLAVLAASLNWPARWLHLPLLWDDWIFSRHYVRGGEQDLALRLERIARELVAAARREDADEIVVIGHSLGAVLAIDLLDRAFEFEPAIGRSGGQLALLSVGSSILKIGLHRKALRLRSRLVRVASAGGLFWAEYQALTDVMNFYKTDPMISLGLTARGPLVRIVRIREMLFAPIYRRIRYNFYRVHCQFVSANDRRVAYDYFMLVCGPLSAECQARSPDGAACAIGPDGTLLQKPGSQIVPESQVKAGQA